MQKNNHPTTGEGNLRPTGYAAASRSLLTSEYEQDDAFALLREVRVRRLRATLAVLIVVLPWLIVPAMGSADQAGRAGGSDSHRVVFLSGGTIDDYMAFVLLTTMENVSLQAVVVTNADCIAGPAMDVQWKVSSYTGSTEIPVALSEARGWNPFPWSYRADCIRFGRIEALKPHAPNPNWPPYPSGEELLEELLIKAIEKDTQVTLLVTCPVTALASVLADDPGLEHGIERLIFMGGAVDVPGNLDPNTIPKGVANPSAEWNIFWDPVSTERLFRNTSFPIVLFTLDVTNEAKITPSFRSRLNHQSSDFSYSRLASDGYALTSDQPFYCMWNVVTTCYVPHPEFFDEPTAMNLKVVTEGYDQGTLVSDSAGREVGVILDLKEPQRYYEYVLQQLAR